MGILATRLLLHYELLREQLKTPRYTVSIRTNSNATSLAVLYITHNFHVLRGLSMFVPSMLLFVWRCMLLPPYKKTPHKLSPPELPTLKNVSYDIVHKTNDYDYCCIVVLSGLSESRLSQITSTGSLPISRRVYTRHNH